LVSKGELLAALERAHETLRRSRTVADLCSHSPLRDALKLEAVALQSVIERLEQVTDAATEAQSIELRDEIDRVWQAIDRLLAELDPEEARRGRPH